MVKGDILIGKSFHKIVYKLLVMTAVVVAGMKNVRAVNEHYFRGLIGYDADGDRVGFGTGKGVAEYL